MTGLHKASFNNPVAQLENVQEIASKLPMSTFVQKTVSSAQSKVAEELKNLNTGVQSNH